MGKASVFLRCFKQAKNRTLFVHYKGGVTTTTTYTFDAANQLTGVNGQGYSYDANGNMTAGGGKSYVYDAENRLVEVKNSAGSTIAAYEYDALGRRTGKTVSGVTTKFYYDGDSTRVLYETDTANNIVAQYAYDTSGKLISLIRGGATYYYQFNGHGDVVALTDANGAVVSSYDYDAYGNVISKTGSVQNPYLYAGYRYDEETGLYYLNARYYAPELGRFITRDSFHGFKNDPKSINLYTYAYSNPVTYIDPSGNIAINFDMNLYLGSGGTARLRINGSTWNWGWDGSISAILDLKLTWGAIGIAAGSYFGGKYIKQMALKWLEKNTFLKERIKDIFKISAISALVYDRIVGQAKKVITSTLKFADNAIMKIPGATNIAWAGTIRKSVSW